MNKLSEFLLWLDMGFVCLGLLLMLLAATRLRPANAVSLFIWGCSVPLTIVCFACWIYGTGGNRWTLGMLLIEILLLAQLGWLGGALAVASRLIKTRAAILKKMALWTSVVSVTGHGLFFLVLILDDSS